MNECVIEWIKGGEYAGVTAYSGSKLKNKLIALAESNPDEVKIINENSDGSIFAHVPLSYIKVSKPRKVSDEQKQKAAERFAEYRKNNGK